MAPLVGDTYFGTGMDFDSLGNLYIASRDTGIVYRHNVDALGEAPLAIDVSNAIGTNWVTFLLDVNSIGEIGVVSPVGIVVLAETGQGYRVDRTYQLSQKWTSRSFRSIDLGTEIVAAGNEYFSASGISGSGGIVTFRSVAGGGVLPSAPATCSIVRDGETVRVTWTDTVLGDAYIVSRSVGTGTFYWRAKVQSGSELFSDSNRSGKLTYQIIAIEGIQRTDPRTCTTNDSALAAIPVNSCSATFEPTSGYGVTWNGASEADHLIIERSVDSGPWYWRGRIKPSDNFVDPPRGTSVRYRTKAKYGTDFSTYVDCDQALS